MELAVITYDDEVQLRAPLMPVQQDALIAAVGSIFPGGQTNLSGGWLKGMEVIQQAPSDGPRKALLLTDGQANVGIVDRPSLVSMTAKAAGTGVGGGRSASRLTARRNPNPRGDATLEHHWFIEPAHEMPERTYVELLTSTRARWRRILAT